MNRIGGPSALPHSRTCSRRPPPPCTSWMFVLGCATVVIWRLLVSVAMNGSCRGGGWAASVESGVSSAAGVRILPPPDAYERLPRPGRRRDTGRMEASARGVFVGRERELGELEVGELGRALDVARAGSGTAVLVAGEAGIGKTRLASELAARARHAGFEVLVGRSIDLVGTELPYQPLVEAVGPLGGLPQVD